jgi:uncharacterized OB-fold protein
VKPVPDADTKPYWDGIAAGELRLQRCEACGEAVFYPRAVCPHCFSGALTWFTAAGTGSVYSYTVAHRGFGDFAEQAPFTVALIDLDEGVRMMTRIVGTRNVAIGMRVRMTVEEIADVALPCFRPATPEAPEVLEAAAPETVAPETVAPEVLEAPGEPEVPEVAR